MSSYSKKIGIWTVLFLLIYCAIELMAWTALFLLRTINQVEYTPMDGISTRHQNIISSFIEGADSRYITFSPRLGWTIQKNGRSNLYQANSKGFRSSKEYDKEPPTGIRRIATFGDSFVHCQNVSNNATWQVAMESSSSNLEVLNFGISGFGLDQAYLRYLEECNKRSVPVLEKEIITLFYFLFSLL